MTLSKTHKAYFNIAKEVSLLSDFPRTKTGAVAVYKHHIVSSGCNSTKTAPLQKKLNSYRFSADTQHCIHAEVACLKPLINRKDIDFKNVELYVYREYQTGELAIAKPCASCEALIKSLGIRHIYYTGDKSYVYEEYIN